MSTAIVCIALLGVLVFGLGFAVSMTRMRSQISIGHPEDPADPLHKVARAHGNAAEYNPMLAVLIGVIGARDPSTLALGLIGVVTAARYLHAAGMVLSPTLARPHPLRFAGAALTYAGGLALCAAAVGAL